MRNLIPALLVSLMVFLAAPASAEIYKYIDENGQKRWTDDLSQVPKEQRQAAQRISQTESGPDAQAETAGKTTPPSLSNDGQASNESSAAIDAPSREALEQERAALDARYQELVEERQTLEKLNAEPLDATARAELNQRIGEYNKKTEQYEAQLSLFNQKISAYNQSVMSKNQLPPAK